MIVAGLVGVLLLCVATASNSLRWSNPVPAMREHMNQYQLPAEASLLRTDESFDRVCFLQCSLSKVVRYYELDGVEDTSGLCADLRPGVEAWTGETTYTEMDYLTEEVAVCTAYTTGVEGHSSWCADATVLNDVGQRRNDADFVVRLIARC